MFGFFLYTAFSYTIDHYLLWVQIDTSRGADGCKAGFMKMDGKCWRRKITHDNICWNILGIQHFIIPLLLMFFKRDKDIFTSFSKLDQMAYATIFMEKTSYYGRSVSSHTQSEKLLKEETMQIRELIN